MLNDDYIKRSDALFELHHYESGNDPSLIIAYRVDLCEIIEKIPAADVEGKRMTGVWLEQDETPNVRSDKIYRCSVCGCADEQSPSAEVPYCWHCGSKMKREVK